MKTILSILAIALSASAWATGSSTPTPTPVPSSYSTKVDVSSDANAVSGAVSGSTSNATGGNSNSTANGGNSSATVGNVNAGGGNGYGGAGGVGQGGNSSSSAAGGMGGASSLNDQSRSNTYVFPAPSMAAQLPGYICPKGDSVSWSIGWNFFSYASSSTRTELECLEKYAALFKQQNAQQQPVMPSMYVVPFSTVPEARLPDPVVTPVAPAASEAVTQQNTMIPAGVVPAAAVAPTQPKKPAKKAEPKKPAASIVEPSCGDNEVLSCQPKKSPIIKKIS